jgi:tetratricopeptide (TPR) repeat protein
MGTVYRASDALSGQLVALKLLHADGAEALQRFTREAQVLASLSHPGIVSYVAHGTTSNGRPFLVMEWLEGEDLARRLARQPLSVQESLALLSNVAEALALAHRRGIIHRDLKPSNLFLRHGNPEEVVLVDFGLARNMVPSHVITLDRTVMGTPGYMAPEQVLSQSQLTPAADIFSLGCVLYECLTGRPPFAAPHFAAALAKILFTEPELLRALRPELPFALQALIERMLAKEPSRRIPDATGLLEALAKPQAQQETEAGVPPPQSVLPGLTGAEQQLVSVLLAASCDTLGEGDEDLKGALRDELRSVLAPHGAPAELLADGSLVITVVATQGSATDPARLVARCALLVQERWPRAAVVLTTGRGRLDQRLPVGEVMDRAGQLLRQVNQASTGPGAPVLLDDVTAGLLGAGFLCSRSSSGVFRLHGEQLGMDESRPLLGKPTPCVGREQELALLEAILRTCVQESTVAGVLVTASPGVGKSRLQHEFLRRLERQGQTVRVLLGRGDPMSAGTAGGLIGQALRWLCGVTGSEPLRLRQSHLRQRIAQHLAPNQDQEVVEFLGELCGIPFSDEHHPRLRAARRDPRLMSAQLGRAWVDFLKAECSHSPVLLVLEDLHWGDALSVKLMDEALRELADQPFMVLAMARPEVEQLLSLAPSARSLQRLPLRTLSGKACARLVREVLGAQAPDGLIDQLIEQSAGNALFLEELIRGVAEGRGDAPPETVLAMLQARLSRLEPEGREVLLAASFFGRTFWAGGVSALLGEVRSPKELEKWLHQLVAWEWVEPQPIARFPGEAEYRFRHALVRDAAYGLVPDSHKSTHHQRAGQWLEQRGENNPRVLGEHARLGQQPGRAIHFYTQAAEQLFDRHDMPGMEQCLKAALALEPEGESLTQVRSIQAIAAFWMGDYSSLYELGSEVLPRLKAGSPRWCKLVSGLSLGCGMSARKEYLLTLCQLLLDTEPDPESEATYYQALCLMGSMTGFLGAIRQVDTCRERLERAGRDVIARDPLLRGWRSTSYSFESLYLRDNPWKALDWAEQAAQTFREVGSERDEMGALFWKALALKSLGNPEEAVETARRCVTLALRVGQPFGINHSRQNLMLVLASSLTPDHQQEAQALAHEFLEARDTHRLHLGSSYLSLAVVALLSGELPQAEARTRQARELLLPFSLFLPQVRWLSGMVLLFQGRAAEARQEVELALREAEAVGGGGQARVGLLQVLAESCFTENDQDSGQEALRGALRCLRSRAQGIPDSALRERYLSQVPENARTLALARECWGEAAVLDLG